MWDLPRSGIEPMSPTSAGRFFTAEPPGKSSSRFLKSPPGDANGKPRLRSTDLVGGRQWRNKLGSELSGDTPTPVFLDGGSSRNAGLAAPIRMSWSKYSPRTMNDIPHQPATPHPVAFRGRNHYHQEQKPMGVYSSHKDVRREGQGHGWTLWGKGGSLGLM